MTTQTAPIAQSYPKSNGGFKTLFAIIAGIFLFYAVQSHLVTDAFCALLSLVFDNFHVKATGLLPDLIILILFALLILGIKHLMQFYPAIFFASLILWGVVSFWQGLDNGDPAKHTNGLKMLSTMAKGE